MKPVDCYFKDKSTKDGLNNCCKPCKKEYQKQYFKTEAGKAALAKARTKYRQTEAGKALEAKRQTKYRTKIPPGVYQVLNKVTGEVYVGQSKIPNNRRSRHWELLRGGKHENPNLQEAYDKYGKDAFVFKILEHCEPDKLLEREEHWINKFLDNCYNVVGVEK
jgi:hypothetical protein